MESERTTGSTASETTKGRTPREDGTDDRMLDDHRRRWVRLASRSPRRYALLARIGIECEVIDAPIEEVRRPGEAPRDFVERMAREKALAGLEALGDLSRIDGPLDSNPLLAADTAVVLDERVLGKPRDIAHAQEMLQALSGRMHRVVSAVAVIADHRKPRIRLSESRVWFKELSAFECQDYGASGEGLDKAGAYSIQGRAAIFITRLDGSHSGVMGLPLFETAELLHEIGFLLPRP